MTAGKFTIIRMGTTVTHKTAIAWKQIGNFKVEPGILLTGSWTLHNSDTGRFRRWRDWPSNAMRGG